MIYTSCFAISKKLDVCQIIEEIGQNSVPFCYEKPSDFCHRQIVCYIH